MTPNQIKSALAGCYAILSFENPTVGGAKELDDRLKGMDRRRPQLGFHPHLGVRHLMWMCDEAQGFVDVGQDSKANRWLGFIQGCLWMLGYCSINTFRDMCREDKPEYVDELGDPMNPNGDDAAIIHSKLKQDPARTKPDELDRAIAKGLAVPLEYLGWSPDGTATTPEDAQRQSTPFEKMERAVIASHPLVVACVEEGKK